VFDLLDRVAGEVGEHFVRRWEEKKRPHRMRSIEPGTLAAGDVPDLGADELGKLAEGRTLLFIHGTASRCHSGFGRLPDPVLERLGDRYAGRVAGFDHPTIGYSPTENATWLGEQFRELSSPLEVDVIAHSRGGLVTRVLSEQPGAAGLDPGAFRVRSAVFVGTPNAGTPLADFDHLGKLVDNLTNLLELVPDNPVTDPLEVILSVVKQLAVGALKGLDGLTAMSPGGPYLSEFLNVPSGGGADYRAVCSNFEPAEAAPLGRIARDLATDAIFDDHPNDLVVPTVGVHAENGSSHFPVADPLTLDAREAVDHSSFWVHPRVHEAFERWLPGA
jgi:pimeloyl-ACP methyl ester carboxylesterase